MRSRFHAAVLLVLATALLICGAFVAQNAQPSNLLAKPGAPPVHQYYQ
jgi:hypothetical protein